MQYCEFPIYPFKPNLLNIQIFISFIKSKVLENPLRRVCDAAPFLGNCTVLTHGFLWRQKFLVQDSLGMNEIGSFSKGCKVISTVLTQVKSGKTKARVKGKMEG